MKMWNVQFSNSQNSITFVNYLKRTFLTHPQGEEKNDVPRLEVVLIGQSTIKQRPELSWFRSVMDS